MRKILFAGNFRGFFKHLIDNPPKSVKYYINSRNNFYEKNSNIKIYIKRLFKSKIFDFFGVIISVNLKKYNNNDDIYLIHTYNHFAKCKKNYCIIVENPTALYHYCLNRRKSYLGKRQLKKMLNQKNLKALVCLSKACESTINELLNYDLRKDLIIKQIYPYVPQNSYVNIENIKECINNEYIKCLFITSDFRLKSGYEIIKAFENIKNQKIKLTIITDIKKLEKDIITKINKIENIKLLDFSFDYKELEKIYSENDILVHPTRQDSSPLVVLEAIKAGLCVLATDLYAISEMIQENINGYLVNGKYNFFSKDTNLPNEIVWNNRNNTIYSDYIDDNIVNFIIDKLTYLNNNRNILKEMRLNSLSISMNDNFSKESILKKWDELYKEIG